MVTGFRQYTTTDEFQAQFGSLSYDATAYVIDTSLSDPQVVFASGGGVETCNLVIAHCDKSAC